MEWGWGVGNCSSLMGIVLHGQVQIPRDEREDLLLPGLVLGKSCDTLKCKWVYNALLELT